MLTTHRDDLDRLTATDRLRALAPRRGVDFASNDYLGLAGSTALAEAARAAIARGVPLGSGGSRLLRGNHPEHQALEAEAARFFGSEAALFLANGYVANLALFATLPQRGDLVVYDAHVHASAHDGMRLGRAQCVAAAHNDAQSFADAIATWRGAGNTGRVWIAVESVYSMDGDRAPLDALADIAGRHDAFLLIDEAHATGVFGRAGRGVSAGLEGLANVVTLHGCGKALGVEGALLCLPTVLRDFLVNRARAFVFSTAPSPLIAAVVRQSLVVVADGDWRRERLTERIALASDLLGPLGATVTDTQIVPLILGGDARAMAVAERAQAAGFDLRGIRPPTVAPGSARLRISLTLNATADDLRALASVLGEAL